MRTAIIGLGNMGGRLARRLLQQGGDVGVYDTNDALAQQLASEGATAYGSLREIGAAYDTIMTVLPDARIVRQVVLGPGGLAEAMRPGSLIIDITTSTPAVTQEIAAALAPRGIRLLDAPVSGGVQKAEQGTLTVMVGGDAAVLDEVRPLLQAIGQHVVHVGDIGAGHTAKALNNLITAATLAVTSEAMALGAKLGVAAPKMLEVINLGSGRSAASETKFPQQVLSRKFSPGFSLGLMCKDVGIAIDMAHQARLPLWVSPAVYELWKYGVAQGHGDTDHTGIALVVEDVAGVRLEA